MGKIYAGEELSINIEDFISLPERGNLLFDWSLETKPSQFQSLPSNFKVSNSGRSVLLKELKKGRLGVLDCVIYSSTRFAVAKRRFNILNIAESVKRRSTTMHLGEDKSTSDLQRSRRCRHIIRRSQEKAMQRLQEEIKPKSRKKRFKRMGSHLSEVDCEPLRKKIYSRWVRSLFGDFTTKDPRLLSLKKLFELSEEGDGTLDDVIPHEVHYVEPKVLLVNGTSSERSANQLHFSRNCSDNANCGNNAICIMPPEQQNYSSNDGHSGYCYCLPAYYGDGITCRKIPASNHRDKRLKRNAVKDFAVPQHLFYEQARRAPTSSTEMAAQEEEDNVELPPKVLAFEEEESFLLSNCIDDKDCSLHASCVQPSNGHPYCKCRPGYRGNGVFCWETIDYVPPEENFLSEEEEIRLKGPTTLPDASMLRLVSRTPTAEEFEDE